MPPGVASGAEAQQPRNLGLLIARIQVQVQPAAPARTSLGMTIERDIRSFFPAGSRKTTQSLLGGLRGT
jgi:hypothetical protein